MINLFAFRAIDPGELKKQDKPVGYKNNYHIIMQSARAELIVAAWGNHGSFLKRDKKVLKLLNDVPSKCFKLTSKRQPGHPLYQPKDIVLVDYRMHWNCLIE